VQANGHLRCTVYASGNIDAQVGQRGCLCRAKSQSRRRAAGITLQIGRRIRKSEHLRALPHYPQRQNFLICAQDRISRLSSASCCVEHKTLRRSVSRRHSSRLSMRWSMYPTSNSFVFRASFSSTRNRSSSMRNNDSSRLMAGTGSIRSCGGAPGSNRMIGLRLVAAH
jgi:hypothetical protein